MERCNGSRAAHGGLTRRTLLGGGSALAAAAALGGAAHARGGGARPVLVQVFLRGGMDGLTAVVPYGDGDLYAQRPALAVQPPGGPSGARDLDGFFGLAPAAAPLLTPYSDGRLAIVHAAGSIDPTRSHFDACTRMEHGTPGLPAGLVRDGWIARLLAETRASSAGPLRAVGAGFVLPRSLDGAERTLPVPDLAHFLFPGRASTAEARAAALASAWSVRPAPTGTAALDTLAGVALLAGVDVGGHVPANGAVYPETELGTRLRHAAALIHARAGVEVVTIDVEGWDLHARLGPLDGDMARLLDELARALEAFYLDLLGRIDDYVLVCLTEFGRRVAENGSAGVDHGHGTALLVMGGGVLGGRVVSAWPGLAPAALDQGDLAVTIDYRDVLGEIVERRLGVDPTRVFPQHAFVRHGLVV